MSDIEVTIRLPEELLKRVQAVGLQIEDLPTLIEEQLRQREQQKQPSIRSFVDLADRIAALPDENKPTPGEIEDEIRTAREDIAAERHGSQPK